ncbi:TonB family protein [Microvirga sp. STR05]|uniref:TonB family protein n=1 Tax=Hymenobacter duratus TaxID=2771356 RepID=A0ABR8JBG5_9BACT|nr:energy transducer TonB [Hymenobacter duratus]MBD2713873.1 TonB family protein [Hymenobacter duratus]MBR7948775.1 TonB family protein [Microvirga sp. STR05]
MNTLDLRTATLDDMVFEGRNKAYGAFILRRLYHQHLARASAIAILLSLLFISSPLIVRWLFPPLVEAAAPIELPPPVVELMKPPVLDSHKEVAPPVAPVRPIVRPPAQDIATQVVKDELVKPEIVKPTITDVGPITDIETIAGSTGKSGTGTGTGTGKSDSGTTKPASPPAPFITAEVMPQFVGGNEALMKYMQKNLKYPPLALRSNIEGKVFISFTVQADGSIADVQVLKGLGFGTDEEAVRVVKGMPAWVPGQQNKRSVAVRYNMPITFRYD